MHVHLRSDAVDLLDGRISIRRSLLDRCALADSGRTIFLAGSLVEGLGNMYSDLDVYSIGNELPVRSELVESRAHRLLSPERRILRSQDPPDSRVFLAHVVVDDTPVKIDVEFQTHDFVRALAARFRELHAYAAANPMLLSRRLAPREEDFVVRLLNGHAYAGAAQELKREFDRNQFLYLAYRWHASDFGAMLDLIGAWTEGNLETAVDLARENLIAQMQGFLHLRGMANLRRKWLMAFIDRLLHDEARLVERFKSLFFFDSLAAAAGSAAAYVLASLDLVEEIFQRSEPLLVANGTAPVAEQAIELLARDRDMSKSPYAELEYDYRTKVYGRRGRSLRSYLQAFS